MNFRALFKGLLLIGVFVASGFLLGDLIDKVWINEYVAGQGVWGYLIYLFVGVLLTAVGVSRQAVAFLGGYAFGLLNGTLLSLLATLGGCILTYLVARFFAHDYLARHYSSRVVRIDRFIHAHPFSMTLVIRLLPAGSNVLVNLAAGFAQVSPLPFFAGSGFGYIPQMVIFALIGSGVTLDPQLRIGVGVVLFIISALLGVHLYRRYRAWEAEGGRTPA